MGVIYTQSWKQCALSVITTKDLWHFVHLHIAGTNETKSAQQAK